MQARSRRRFRHWLAGPQPPRRPDLCQPFIAVPKWERQPNGTMKNVGAWRMPEELEVICQQHMARYDALSKPARMLYGIFGAKCRSAGFDFYTLVRQHGAAWRSAPEEVRRYLSDYFGLIAVEDL